MYDPLTSRQVSPASHGHNRTASRRNPGGAALVAATLPLVVLAASFPAVSTALVVGVVVGAAGGRAVRDRSVHGS